MAVKPEQIITDLIAEIRGSVSAFDKNIPIFQRRIMAEVDLLAKSLETSVSGNIIANAKNLRTVGAIQSRLNSIVNSPEYRAAVKDYAASFRKVGELNDKYFSALVEGYTQPSIVGELQNQSIEATINSLTEAGIGKNITQQIQNILRTNITTGGSFAGLAQQLRDYLTDNRTGVGVLQRYTKQITTDALNQYSAQYVSIVSRELGFEWFRYTGSEIETSRPFCKALLDKKYFRVSEIPDLLAGRFPEFKANDGVIDSKTDLPSGMINGTNAENFMVYRGGYNCRHQIVGVPTDSVPKQYRDAIL